MDIQDPQNTPDDTRGDPGLTSATGATEQTDTVAGVADTDQRQPTADTQPPATDSRADSSDESAGLAETAPLPVLQSRGEAAATRPMAGAGADAGQSASAGAALPVGAEIGEYRIVESGAVDARGPFYVAEPKDVAAHPEEAAPGLRYIVRELTDGASDQLAHIVTMGLRHPVLLTPVALAREDGRLFLVSMEIANEHGVRVPPMSVCERLRPVDALRAGIELADALATMHRNSLAHLHISPAEVTLYDGRIYLSGVEDATLAATDDDARPLFARDANFLARTMGVIGGVLDTPTLDEDTSAQRSLREIALRGEASAFTRAEELAESFALTLQMLASAGAEMGADIRSVRLAITADAATTVGLVRAANQDAYGLAFFNVYDDAAADAPVGVFLVADGMGGEAHGEIASRLVARTVTAEMTRQFTLPTTTWPAQTVFDPAEAVASAPGVTLAQALELAVKEANRQTRAFGQRLKATTGSTVTALAVSGARAAIAHLGDSRAYLLRDNQLLQLTEDHSLLARMEAVKHPMLEDPTFIVPRSVLYRSVGQEDDVSPDMMEFAIAPGDRMLLCCDGLWDELAPQVIGQVMAEASSPRSCARDLVALANASGGNDNSTAVVIFVEAEAEDDAVEQRAARGFSAETPGDASADAADAERTQDIGDALAGVAAPDTEDAQTIAADDTASSEPPISAE
jgi:serine/threonine protein phosphatase PrpC